MLFYRLFDLRWDILAINVSSHVSFARTNVIRALHISCHHEWFVHCSSSFSWASPPFSYLLAYPNPLHTYYSKRTRLTLSQQFKYSLNWWRSCRDYLGLLGHLSGSMRWRKELERSPREFLPGSCGPAGQRITIINCSIHLGSEFLEYENYQ